MGHADLSSLIRDCTRDSCPKHEILTTGTHQKVLRCLMHVESSTAEQNLCFSSRSYALFDKKLQQPDCLMWPLMSMEALPFKHEHVIESLCGRGWACRRGMVCGSTNDVFQKLLAKFQKPV